MRELKEKQSRKNSRAIKQSRGSSSRDVLSNLIDILGFFYRTKAPKQVKDGDSVLSTRFLEHCSVTSPPSVRRKSYTLNLKCCF